MVLHKFLVFKNSIFLYGKTAKKEGELFVPPLSLSKYQHADNFRQGHKKTDRINRQKNHQQIGGNSQQIHSDIFKKAFHF